MKSLSFHILYLIMIIGYGQVYSQYSRITGQVVDYDTKEPIPGLTVYLKSNNSLPVGEGTSTDRDGKFSLDFTLHDTVNLIIEKLTGYSTLTKVKNIYSTINNDIGKIFHLQRSDIICILPDVSDRKTRRSLKRENKIKDQSSTVSIDNSDLRVSCAPNKSYKIIITDNIAAIDFKDILNCKN